MPKQIRDTLEGEIWKDIPMFNGDYSVSNLGRLYSNKYGRFLNPSLVKGYYATTIKRVFGGVHIFVANAFLGYDIKSEKEINHIDGNKLNNRPENLEIVTHKENIRHAWRTGLITPKEKSLSTRREDITDTQKVLNDFVDNVLKISRKEFEERTGVSKRIFNDVKNAGKITQKTILKIKQVYPSFPLMKNTVDYTVKPRDYSKKTATEWFNIRKWTGFLMTLPLNKTQSFICDEASHLMTIRSTASMLSNNKECDRVFKISANFDKKEIIITANKKNQ